MKAFWPVENSLLKRKQSVCGAGCIRTASSSRFSGTFRVFFQEADSYTVVDDSLDLEGIIRDAVVLDLPFQPVCKPECYGLDPQTGEKRTEPGLNQNTRN
jgi:uncharacterized protein